MSGYASNQPTLKYESEDDDFSALAHDEDGEGEPESEPVSTATIRRPQRHDSPAIKRLRDRSASIEYKPPRKVRNKSRSMYQLNDRGHMVDTSSMPTSAPRVSTPQPYQPIHQPAYYSAQFPPGPVHFYGQPPTHSDADDDADGDEDNNDGDWTPIEVVGQKRRRH